MDGGRGGKVSGCAQCVADFVEEVEVDGNAGDVSAGRKGQWVVVVRRTTRRGSGGRPIR